MQLEFLNQLDEKGLIDLINYVIEKKASPNILPDHQKAATLEIYNEPDRCDGQGDQEFYVHAWNSHFNIGGFLIQDFKMRILFSHEDYSAELREYMTSIFGESYLQSLDNYYSFLAAKERTRLESFKGMGR